MNILKMCFIYTCIYIYTHNGMLHSVKREGRLDTGRIYRFEERTGCGKPSGSLLLKGDDSLRTSPKSQ
jgi:hypothetical protein